jgi:hypothetical protein
MEGKMTSFYDKLLEILKCTFPGEHVGIDVHYNYFGEGDNEISYHVFHPDTQEEGKDTIKIFYNIKHMDDYIMKFHELTVDHLLKEWWERE